jgi:hypothetical protein
LTIQVTFVQKHLKLSILDITPEERTMAGKLAPLSPPQTPDTKSTPITPVKAEENPPSRQSEGNRKSWNIEPRRDQHSIRAVSVDERKVNNKYQKTYRT